METAEYQTLFETETSHWWFQALQQVLLDTCRRVGIGPGSLILDAGCGTGKNIELLSRQVSPRTFGFDISPVAASFWGRRGIRQCCVSSVNAIPFQKESFDAAISVDLLECDGVDERKALQELWRVLRKGGFLILVVPAYRWLMSPEHHRAVRASRRYTRERLRRLLQPLDGNRVRMTHLYLTLFPPIALYRSWKRLTGNGNGHPRSELRKLPRGINAFLFRAVDWERRLHPYVNFPFGSSILAVVEKQATDE